MRDQAPLKMSIDYIYQFFLTCRCARHGVTAYMQLRLCLGTPFPPPIKLTATVSVTRSKPTKPTFILLNLIV